MDAGLSAFIMFALVGTLVYFIMSYLSDKIFKYKMQALIKESFQSLRGV